MRIIQRDQLAGWQRELLETAKQAAVTASCAYSHFPVGAALRIKTPAGAEVVVPGNNYELATYRSVCAERHALHRAYAEHTVIGEDGPIRPEVTAVAVYCAVGAAPLHLRRILRDAAKHDGTPLKLRRLRPKIKQRPIVLLADISGSMDKYSRLLLHFFYAAVQGLEEVECFVFGTRLTRITQHLRVRNVEIAVEQAAREILDWAGGTRIGDSLAAFNRQWSRRVLRRGAVVIVASDGWERGDAGRLRREMRYLNHRCHRLIWLNPHLGHPEYQPLVEGMAAALPYVDDFLPVHNLRSLRDFAAALESLPARRTPISVASRV